MDPEREPGTERGTASGAYALGRLWRAIETATTHPDPDVRARAGQKALAWEAVLNGVASGTLEVGSRTPVASTPAWVTLEVAHGGFATGRYVAEEPLDEAERALLDALPPSVTGSTDRMRLNRWFLTDGGLAQLERALHDGTYAIEVPEHAALLVVAWLVANGHDAAALDLVAELHPLIDRLRFSPVLTEASPASAAVVHLRSVGQVIDHLRRVRPPEQVIAMNEALLVWRPLYDRLVDLWLQTVEGDWPCARWPADWPQGRARWLADDEAAGSTYTRCAGHRRARSNYAILRSALVACPHDSSQLTGRDVGRVRMVLRRSTERWGVPGSPRLQELRDRQARWATRPTNERLATALVDRLRPVPRAGGLGDPSAVLAPVEIGGQLHDVPPTLARKVERAREAPIEDLVAAGVIPSSEVLAAVLPQITSRVAAAAFADPALRELHARVYAAFRLRRSLLLLHLQHQVQLEELPWVRALAPFALTTPETRARAAQALREGTLLALTSYPQTILPNPLVRELTALARHAELDMPFVEEVAADIFMGTFTAKWRAAAALASSVMADTLYARYYDLPAAERWDAGPAEGWWRRRIGRRSIPVAMDFASLCVERSREAAAGDGGFVARNGAILEQSQILTTHNLALLLDRVDLRAELSSRAAELAGQAFRWVVREQNTELPTARAKLQMVKNTAYAWRQAIFFLSLASTAEQAAVVGSLRSWAEAAERDWSRRFEPALAGIELVVRGGRFDGSGRAGDARRFLGWSVGPHWLLPAKPPAGARP